MSPSERRAYRFGPRDARGLIFGVRPAQASTLVLGAVTAVAIVRGGDAPIRVALAASALVLAAGIAIVPLHGRPIESWLPLLTRHVAAAVSGRRRVVAAAGAPARAVRAPSAFAPFELVAEPGAGSTSVGVIVDRRQRRLSAALVVDGAPFVLEDDGDREHRVAAWSNVLGSFGAGPEHPFRMQWIERTVPDAREAIRKRAASVLADGSPVAVAARASYHAFVEAESVDALRHECVLVVTVRSRGWPERSDDARQLVRSLASLEQRLGDAGVPVRGALSPDGLWSYLARSFAPRPPDRHAPSPWPSSTESAWAWFRTDGLVHATYWIAEWPRADVAADFLLPLLHEGATRRTVSVVMEPIPPAVAVRRAEHARTSAAADQELRRRHGFGPTARTARQADAVARREEELASGHAAFRFSGFVTVSATDLDQLERACGHVEQASVLSRLELRRLYGSQDEAFRCTLPFGRGCR